VVSIEQKRDAHDRFWRGEGPSLILVPADRSAQYDVEGYRERFEDPRAMWAAEMGRARALLDWPTDGIPTVRPNLGVVFIPAIAGQGYEVREGQMPWPGAPLGREALRAVGAVDVASGRLMRLAAEFYDIHRAEGGDQIVAYHPDTQSVFDVAHLLRGTDLFYEMVDDPEWVRELLEICLDLFLRVSRHLKSLLGEAEPRMVHGHGTSQGVYFTGAGARTSEDTASLLSPEMIQEFVLPYTERSVRPFGGGFVHFCGRHPSLFEQLCASPLVRAIDLGNSEEYDCRWLLERCAASNTVLYSRIAAEPGEDWRGYVRRLAPLVAETGARCILRPMVHPDTREECGAMQDMWHEQTDNPRTRTLESSP
jgi:hypothetical protein